MHQRETAIPSKKILGPAILGNFLEWYDFSLYGLLATILANQFFPSSNQFLSLLAIFSVLAIGYLIRPLGGIFFSHLSDRYGRKKALSTTLFMMAISTAFIGLLPTYHQIGITASILLIAFRVLQGFALGGEYSGSMVYLVEHAPANRKGFYGSFVLFGTYIGILVGSLVGFCILQTTEGTSYISWSWRIPFLLGSVIGLVGLYIRRKMPETPHFEKMKSEKNIITHPLCYVFKHHRVNLLKALGIMLLPAVSSYLTFVYFPNYLTLYAHIDLTKSLLISTGTTLVMLVSIPIVGRLSDFFDKKYFVISSALLFIILSVILFKAFINGSLWQIFLSQAAFAIMVAMVEAITPALLADLFPANIRCTAVALPINIGNGFFGGTTPLVITLLMQVTHSQLIPAFYLMLIASITLGITLSLYRFKVIRPQFKLVNQR